MSTIHHPTAEAPVAASPEKFPLSHACPVCGSQAFHAFIELPDLPVFCNTLWESPEEAARAPRGTIQLALCDGCGHIFNQAFQPELVEYSAVYENSLHFSPRFNQYASWLADTLIERHDLHGKTVVEIGSGKGEFLRLLVERGSNRGYGFDPSYEPGGDAEDERLTFIRDLYSERYADIHGQFYLSRHTFEHLPDPGELMRALRSSIPADRRTSVFVEVPDATYMIQQGSIWDVIYEHVSYFSAASLSTLFSRNGFRPRSVSCTYEGQFLCLEAETGGASYSEPLTQPYTRLQVGDFAARALEKVAGWKEQIARLRAEGKRAVVWGAGSKGVTFLNMIQPNGEVPFVVDVNPRKTGKFVVGTGHQIVQPEALRDVRPEVILIMNPIYRQEIEHTAEGLGLSPEYLVV